MAGKKKLSEKNREGSKKKKIGAHKGTKSKKKAKREFELAEPEKVFLLCLLINDNAFRKAMREDTAKALRSVGIKARKKDLGDSLGRLPSKKRCEKILSSHMKERSSTNNRTGFYVFLPPWLCP